ncbi:unnamed protein product, partial [marine sediment metagenome]
LAAAALLKLHQARVAGAEKVEIWGDGTVRREFMYAGDLADAILTAAERFATLPPIMNVGAGTDSTVNQYYQTAAEVVGYQGTFSHDLSRPVGMKAKLMDVSRATTWGWTASTSLHDGLAATYEWYRENISIAA